ncbi:MAG: hypothetical protein AABZ30_11605 [Myxococcota bacterium]
MDVADLREQVVLDLEVQAPEVPGQEAALAREVDGGRDLMLGPCALDAIRPGRKLREVRLFDAL